jgi:NAD(P)-dependent dehydrogenase (short-subunit alcohol dehydrogenase family)
MSTPVVLITGALTGIGRAAALAIAQEGNRIVVSGRDDERGGVAVGGLLRHWAGLAFGAGAVGGRVPSGLSAIAAEADGSLA